MTTTLKILIFEDELLHTGDFQNAITRVALDHGLQNKGIALQVDEPIVQVTSVPTLEQNLTRVRSECDGARIVFVDLLLTREGLTTAQALDLHNAKLPKTLHVKATDADASKTGGYLLAWEALLSTCQKLLIVFATSQESEDSIRLKMEQMSKTAGRWKKYDVVRGSLAYKEKRASYLHDAVGKWLAAFCNARCRLFPAHAENWFGHGVIPPHNWIKVTDGNRAEYRRLICEYLSNVLNLAENDVYTSWNNLNEVDEEKKHLHDFLKGFVGSCASAYKGIGQRLRWKHLLLVANACAPAPGSWRFSDLFSGTDDFVLNEMSTNGSEDVVLLDLLVGDVDGRQVGLFPLLLADKNNPEASTLKCATANAGLLKVKLTFEVATLKRNFDECKMKQAPLSHDVSGPLYKVHRFLEMHGGSAEVDTNENAILLKMP